MRRAILSPVALTAALAAALTPAPAAAAPLVLKPSSDWALKSYDDKCRMIRTFGSGEDELVLWIDKGGPGPAVNLTLIGRAVRSPYGAFTRIGFAPGDLVERSFITAKSSKGRPVLGVFGVQPVSLLPDEALAADKQRQSGEEQVDFADGALTAVASEATIQQRYAAITALELNGAVIDPITLQIDDMLPMAQQLLACTAALTDRLARASQGGADGSTRIKTRDEATWAGKIQADYPFHLLRAGQQGRVAVRVTVNKEGEPTFCEVTAYDGPASFNDSACLLMLRHAKFSPATDAAGNPVAAFYSTRITYRINN
ncbi:TonB family C-terminal domain-containing protein [Porphyrobacter sp. LM 6]|nr:TonB family C-terminal domain-containing protein [Porphyrobacter sp. LM 6]